MKPLSCLLFSVLLGAEVLGQLDYDHQLLYSPEPAAFASFSSTIVASDLNDDGFADLVVAESEAAVAGVPNTGQAFVLWGPTLSLSKKLESRNAVSWERLGYGYLFPPSASIADGNGDGALDILMSALSWNPSGAGGVQPDFMGRVHIFLGPDWVKEMILTDPTPETYALFGSGILVHDLDHDGLNEVLVGAPGASGATSGLVEEGRAWLWRGTDLAAGVVSSPQAIANPVPITGAYFGYVIRAADYDADGIEDIWIAAPETLTGVPGSFGEGTIHVFDGATQTHIATLDGPPKLSRFGDLRYKGDLTGDGIDDLVVAAPMSVYVASPTMNITSAGAITILPGPDFEEPWKTLWSPDPLKSSFFGAKSRVVDLDADGDLDIVVGDPGGPISDERYVWVFLGPDYTVVQSLADPSGESPKLFGWEVETADIDGDGIPEIIGGAIDSAAQGSLQVYSLRTLAADSEQLSVSQGGEVHLALRLGPGKAGHSYVGAVGISGSGEGVVLGKGSWLPLVPDLASVAGLALVGTPVLPDFMGTLDQDGAATLTIAWPAGFAQPLAGESLTVAVLTSADGKRPGAGSSAVSIQLVP
jgi:hypothetical protein